MGDDGAASADPADPTDENDDDAPVYASAVEGRQYRGTWYCPLPYDDLDRAPETVDSGPDAVTAFLDDDASVEAIRERARADAEARAAELGFDPVSDD